MFHDIYQLWSKNGPVTRQKNTILHSVETIIPNVRKKTNIPIGLLRLIHMCPFFRTDGWWWCMKGLIQYIHKSHSGSLHTVKKWPSTCKENNVLNCWGYKKQSDHLKIQWGPRQLKQNFFKSECSIGNNFNAKLLCVTLRKRKETSQWHSTHELLQE